MASPELTEKDTPQRLRNVVFVMLLLDLLLIGFRVLLYPSFFAQSDALLFLCAPVSILLVYAGIIFAITLSPDPRRRVVLHIGTAIGAITGVMWLLKLAFETFAHFSGIIATAPFLLGGFVLWGIADFWSAWQTGTVRAGVLTAVWSTMICVLMTITFGFILTYTSLPLLAQNLITDPDYLRSHWTDLHAFAIANTFDSGFSHLLGALIIGMVTGAGGGVIGNLSSRWTRRRGVPFATRH